MVVELQPAGGDVGGLRYAGIAHAFIEHRVGKLAVLDAAVAARHGDGQAQLGNAAVDVVQARVVADQLRHGDGAHGAEFDAAAVVPALVHAGQFDVAAGDDGRGGFALVRDAAHGADLAVGVDDDGVDAAQLVPVGQLDQGACHGADNVEAGGREVLWRGERFVLVGDAVAAAGGGFGAAGAPVELATDEQPVGALLKRGGALSDGFDDEHAAVGQGVGGADDAAVGDVDGAARHDAHLHGADVDGGAVELDVLGGGAIADVRLGVDLGGVGGGAQHQAAGDG